MEEKKTVRSKKVAVNPSRGAKKVKTIEEESVPMSGVKETKPRTAAKKAVERKVRAENEKADKREQVARRKAEKKAQKKELRTEKRRLWLERREARKQQAREKRLLAKERMKEKKLAHAARREMLKNETAVQRLERKEREKAEKIALRKQNAQLKHALALKKKEERMHKRALKAENRQHRREQRLERKHAPGFGGWLAAVISLGVTSLAMTTLVVVGAINMDGMNGTIVGGYQSDLYEMTELSENLNANLDKLRVATGREEQRQILTDILVESELLESALQRFPVDMGVTSNIMSFVNRTAAYAREGLEKLSSGTALGMENEASIEYMYATNREILATLQRLRDSMLPADWAKLMTGAADGSIRQGLTTLNNQAITTPATIQDGPFSDNKQKVNPSALAGESEITSAKAEVLLKGYFKDYDLESVDYRGEAITPDLTVFNFTLKDRHGREMYAQVSKTGGKLVMFNSYEKCSAKNFSQEKCVEIAQKFLENLGMGGMKAVWLQENGTEAILNFVCEQDGVLCYSDMAIVKVCETKGKVIGLEALPYYLNHGARTIPSPTVSQSTAAKSLGKLTPSMARLALIPFRGGERLCYEFNGTYDGEEFFAYVDAATGEEIETFTVLNTKQGRVLR